MPRKMLMVSGTVGSPTMTCWNRLSSAASFSMCCRYSFSVVAPARLHVIFMHTWCLDGCAIVRVWLYIASRRCSAMYLCLQMCMRVLRGNSRPISKRRAVQSYNTSRSTQIHQIFDFSCKGTSAFAGMHADLKQKAENARIRSITQYTCTHQCNAKR